MSILDSVPIVSSYRKSSKAEDIISRSKRDHRYSNRLLDETQKKSQQLTGELYDLKIECATTTIEDAISVLEKCQKIKRSETKVAQNDIGNFTKKSLPTLKKQATSISEITASGLKGTAAGAALSLGSMSAVSTLGAASTGTAISTLSGVAASNATMAWFGGGALSAGGAGMAGGAMVLGGIALAPLAVIGAFKYASHAENKLTEAVEFRNQVEEAIEKIDAAIKIAESMNEHVKLFTETLQGLKVRLLHVSENLTYFLENEPDNAQRINTEKLLLIFLIKTVKRLLEVQIFDNNQDPSEEYIRIVDHVHHANEDAAKALIQGIENGIEVTIPKNIKYLSEIQPGENSSVFFWLIDKYEEYKKTTVKKEKPSKNKNSNDISFKDALILEFIACIGFIIAIVNSSTGFALIAGCVILITPLTWLSSIFKNEKFETFCGLTMLTIIGIALFIYFG